jgi:glycosyltransferase involved in cell wall biosynthesis
MGKIDGGDTVSVIMTVHNGEKYLEQSIDSILSQTRKVDEIIIVNDGSTDGTSEILAQFNDKILVLNQEKSGIAIGWNKGVQAAIGKYISFLDSDDYWPVNKIERQLEILSSKSEITISFGYVKQFYSPELTDEMRALKKCPENPEPGFSSGTMLINRDTFMSVGLFNPKWKKGIFSDWFLRATDLELSTHMDKNVFLYRRIHTKNHGILKRDKYNDYVHMLKESLDRRRSKNKL